MVLDALFRGLGTDSCGRAVKLAIERNDRAEAIRLIAAHFRKRPRALGYSAAPAAHSRETADRACRGDVTVVNIDWQFPDGVVDWHFNPTDRKGPANPEWLLQLNRMSFWTHMAEAYHVTKDETYARAFRRQLRDWIATTEPQGSGNLHRSTWRTIEAGLRLMGPWPQAFERFRTSPSLTDEDLCLMLGSMYEQAHHLMAHPTGQNWLLMEMNGVYSFAARFPEFGEAEMLRRESARVLGREMAQQFLPDGYQYELSPDYHLVAYSCFANAYELDRLARRRGELPTDYGRLLENAAQAVLDLSTPGFVLPRCNDCFTISTDRYMGSAVRFFPKRLDFLWLASHRAKGQAPAGESASRLLPYAGYAALRSGWDADATYLMFDFGPLSRGHWHQDKLNVNLWKGDEELVFDDGGGQYESSRERGYAVSAHDHNTLLVDGRGQCRKGPLMMTKPIVCGWKTSARRDEIFGVYDQEFEGGVKPAVQRREIVFDKPADRITVSDTVTSSDGKAHTYELLFQLDTTNVAVAADGKSLRADYGAGRKWALEMTFEGVDAVTPVSGRKTPSLAGWFIGRNDLTNHVATTVFVKAAQKKDHVFKTTLHPVPATR